MTPCSAWPGWCCATQPTIGRVLSLEAGVPSAVAAGLPKRGADYLSYYAGYADKLEGSVIPIFPENAFDYTRLEPLGVIGIIATWNGGISSACRKAGPALAVGNTVVIKPMELAPFSVIRFAELALEAGIPPGVVNVVPGDAAAGRALCEHPGIDKISFTGGIETAEKILVSAAKNITPVVLELGGKSGNIVFPDADLSVAGQFSGQVCMGNAGQGCVFPTRLIVHEDVHDQILEKVVAVAGGLPVGDVLEPTTVVGPIISEGHRDRVMGMIDRARTDASGEIVLGGERGVGELSDGFFIRPTVIDGVDSQAYIAQEEVFGPVLSVMTFARRGRGHRPRQRHPVRPGRLRAHQRPAAGPPGGRGPRCRLRLAQQLRRPPRLGSLRWVRQEWDRQGGRP